MKHTCTLNRGLKTEREQNNAESRKGGKEIAEHLNCRKDVKLSRVTPFWLYSLSTHICCEKFTLKFNLKQYSSHEMKWKHRQYNQITLNF